ncbi:MAG: hypothetical protein QOG43_69 [Actinomycetota bacterium]|nr:hypothetical protein [Actinomycetota bacterium]
MAPSGSDLEVARRLVAERGLAGAAFGHLTVDAFLTLPLEALGPTKALLKRFFSTDGWAPADDDALAAAVGPGEGTWRRALDADVTLDYGWVDGRFGVRVVAAGHEDEAGDTLDGAADSLAGTFDGPVVPEATPNPRSIRFQVGPIHQGPSRWYDSAAAAADDPGAARLFAEFEEVANVLVGPEFVAVGLHRAADWERVLRPVLAVVTDEFADPDALPGTSAPRVIGGPAGAGVVGGGVAAAATAAPRPGPRLSRLDRAWADLGDLHPGGDPAHLARVRAAAADDDPGRRQVAANLLGEADPDAAATDWARLVVDPVRSVRRAAVDAVVDAGRPELRPLLVTALGDPDAWVRWKALRGLAGLGPDESRGAIEALAGDPDFRIRLEVAAALRATRRPG